jgi:hypothetical protein
MRAGRIKEFNQAVFRIGAINRFIIQSKELIFSTPIQVTDTMKKAFQGHQDLRLLTSGCRMWM